MSQEEKELLQKMNLTAQPDTCKIWMFQANPLRYAVYDALADENLKEDTWLVSRYQTDIHAGDIALIWKARQRSGIYAVGDIVSNPQMMYDSEESTKYWKNETDQKQLRLRVKIRYGFKFIKHPILKTELEKISELKNMEILRHARGTNFRVTRSEWLVILTLLKKRLDLRQ
jgi:predicted RNA-binding protein with PUA-like domain